MRYSVLMQPVNEPKFEGYYYAHIPSLDLTTHGVGIEGALKAAQELAEAWLAEKRAHELGLSQLTLYTGEKLGRNITWYTRHGFRIARLETLPDRTIVHMSKAVSRAD